MEKNIEEALRLYCLISGSSCVTQVVIGQDAKEDMQLCNLALTKRAEAECIIGMCYLLGHFGKKDPIKAVRLFQLAAQKGVTPPKNILSFCYENIGLMKMKNKRDVNEMRYWQTEVEKFSEKQIEFTA